MPPLMALTTRMPLPVVSAPGPPALVMCRDVLPVALPPLMTSLVRRASCRYLETC